LDRVEYRFIIGQAPPSEHIDDTENVENEIKNYSDFVVGNFTDTYRNLIYKTHAAYQYTQGTLFNFKFLVKIQIFGKNSNF